MPELEYTVSKIGVTIKDSYLCKKKYFREELEKIKELYPELALWKRSIWSLKKEWAVHNFLFRLKIQTNRTKDVDLDYPQKWYMRLGYSIFGLIAIIFIK